MKSVIRWAVKSTPAMNMLMITVLVLGALSGYTLRRETFPSFELEIILVSVPYPGASPDEVEEGICQKIEEAVRSIEGIKKVTSVAGENAGNVVIELRSDIEDVQKTLGEVESAVDRIPSFPDLAEDPEIQQVTMRRTAIRVAVVAEESAFAGVTEQDAELRMRGLSEEVRDDLLNIPEISNVVITGAKPYQIDVEISEDTLRRYGLTLQQVAQIIRRENLELPGGKLKTPSSEVLLRGKNKKSTGEEIARIPLVTTPSGVVLTVDDLGSVSDDFADVASVSRVNGKPGMIVEVKATDNEDMISMAEAVREYTAAKELPPGYELIVWDDQSLDVADRLDLLVRNGLQGLLLVFLVLACFLELKLAFWVALGIPVSLLGACAVLWYTGQTLNMLSMFSFLMALGIVVDDAIVIGENIYSHREQGKGFLRAAIDGTVEVVPSVAASVTTTIIAFAPMFFVVGIMGKFFAVMPLAIIAMLILSLLESTFILPCHLAHEERARSMTGRLWQVQKTWLPIMRVSALPIALLITLTIDAVRSILAPFGPLFGFLNAKTSVLLDFVINRLYLPALRFTLRAPATILAGCLALLLFSFGFVTNGTVPWIFFPKLDARIIEAQIAFPDGTPTPVTDAATKRIEQTILDLNKEYEAEYGSPLLTLTYRSVGSLSSDDPGRATEGTASGGHVGSVKVELVDNTRREITSQEVTKRWRAAAGLFPGAEQLTFGTQSMGPGGKPIEFKLLAPAKDMERLEAAVEDVKDRLKQEQGVFDVSDDSRPGKWEYQLAVKEGARSFGVSQQQVASTVRSAYYGDEVMRLQRGRHEVKLMVRYPPEERQSLADFNDLRVDGPEGDKIPLEQVAAINVARSYSEVNRLDQRRSITISADVDTNVVTSTEVLSKLREPGGFMDQLLETYPNVRVRWEGQAEQTRESVSSLMVGFAVALIAMFVLLTFQFNAYLQPFIIMAVIPFGAIGAIWGHWLIGLPLTLFSVLGLVALTGVVVNDSIVLVDFINAKLKQGLSIDEALTEAGARRFRPVLLTSATTVAGLFPILMEKSFQAQLLIPMATSLAFGLILATFLVLLLVPTLYLIYFKLVGMPEVSADHEAQPQAPDAEETPEPREEPEPATVTTAPPQEPSLPVAPAKHLPR